MSTDRPDPPAAYLLRLFIAGTAPRSRRTIEIVRRFCETHLAGRHQLEVVDIFQQPALAERDGILAAPTLLKLSPRPEQRLTGILDEQRLMREIELIPAVEQYP
ncbi:circadian clock KaiB family protein [Methylobacterium sp. J-076]|uniref:circadian clock KaiB family protein n=1 Tax=Methylobacterium sp. J-076 TaxID=2836655 RepID=UPI001FB8FA19|nr:circadian clock KaiB family protein [Methylobacterium sp. J-076]MCJ2013663.1 circadian clock KaiB family protein [Methylobacterium sp. J-076]